MNLIIELIDPTQEILIPKRMTDNSVGFDVAASEGVLIFRNETLKIPLGFKLEIEPGYWAMLAPRSSLHKKNLIVPNSIGVIDSDYRGEVMMLVHNMGNNTETINQFERIGQLIILPALEVYVKTGSVNKSNRLGGFGSTS